MHEGDIRNTTFLEKLFQQPFDIIVHLAARAGVRPSIEKPLLYEDVNIKGTINLLEKAKEKISNSLFLQAAAVFMESTQTHHGAKMILF